MKSGLFVFIYFEFDFTCVLCELALSKGGAMAECVPRERALGCICSGDVMAECVPRVRALSCICK